MIEDVIYMMSSLIGLCSAIKKTGLISRNAPIITTNSNVHIFCEYGSALVETLTETMLNHFHANNVSSKSPKHQVTNITTMTNKFYDCFAAIGPNLAGSIDTGRKPIHSSYLI